MTRNSTNSGSVLLLTLMVVSLLMVLVVSFSVYVRLELRSVRDRQALLEAQNNARLSMNLALNKLQLAAGPDQRVTARAELQGTTGSSALWAGVWARNPAGGVLPNPVWLVSGLNPDPAAPGSFEMFPANGVYPEVLVPTEDLLDVNNNSIGELAYWVSDEGVKASVVARRSGVETYTGALAAERNLVEFQADFGVDLSGLFTPPSGGFSFDLLLEDLIFSQNMDLLALPSQIPFVSDQSGAFMHDAEEELPLHDITLVSLGVLENPQTGGLKKNLSDLSHRDNFLATAETAEFLNPNKDPELQIEYGPPPNEILRGDPYFSPRPLLTEAALYIGLFHSNPNGSDGRIRTRYHVEAELLNPYSLPLRLDRGRFGELTMLVRNLPTLTIEDRSGTAPTIVQDLDEAVNNNNANSTGYYCQVEVQSELLNPGEIYQSFAPNQSQGLARNIGNVRWSGATLPRNSAQIRITADHGSDPLIFELVNTSYSGTNRNAPYVQSIALDRSTFPYTNFSFRKTFNGSNPFTRFGSSSSYTIAEYNMAYHYRLWSDETDTTSMRDLMTRVPFLGPDLNLSGTFTDIEGNVRTYEDIMVPAEINPSLAVGSINAFDGLDVLADGQRNNHNGFHRELVLIDVPTEDVLSVGVLTSLPLYQEPLRIIGSPWGGDYNEAFDRYYFSPKSLHPTEGTALMISPALVHADTSSLGTVALADTPDADDAEHEMVVGQFNVNSTSTAAWEAVLGAPVLGAVTSVHGAFFRHPLQVAQSGDYADNLAESQLVDNAFRLGGRALQADVSESILQQLASEVVSRLTSTALPFADLEEFVNSGILQDSLDSILVDYGTGDVGINEGVVSHSNLHFTQNDLLTRLAPTASVRSDTFTIRAYGDVQGASGGEPIARALCEVVVQRIPTKLDGSSPLTPTTSLLTSRSFRILSFRWLTDEDS